MDFLFNVTRTIETERNGTEPHTQQRTNHKARLERLYKIACLCSRLRRLLLSKEPFEYSGLFVLFLPLAYWAVACKDGSNWVLSLTLSCWFSSSVRCNNFFTFLSVLSTSRAKTVEGYSWLV